MREDQSQAHMKQNCKYHVVFIPKVIFGDIRRYLGEILHELARQKGCEIVEGHLIRDHIHTCICIWPRLSVSNVVGYIKGKSVMSITRGLSVGRTRHFTGDNFWARGYFVSTAEWGWMKWWYGCSRKMNGVSSFGWECSCL